MKKRKKSIFGYTIKNWGIKMKQTNIWDFNYIIHDGIYKKPGIGFRNKVKITIEEV